MFGVHDFEDYIVIDKDSVGNRHSFFINLDSANLEFGTALQPNFMDSTEFDRVIDRMNFIISGKGAGGEGALVPEHRPGCGREFSRNYLGSRGIVVVFESLRNYDLSTIGNFLN